MKLYVLRRGVRPAALTGVLVLSLAGCGAEPTSTTEERSTPTASPSTTTTGPSEHSDPSSITLRRVGGIAGFMDVLVVHRDGGATFTSRARARVTCTVNPKVKSQLEAAAMAAAESSAPNTRGKGRLKDRTTYPDAMHLYLSVGDQEVRFEDLGSDHVAYRRLFTLMNSVMGAAETIRAGKKLPGGSACST